MWAAAKSKHYALKTLAHPWQMTSPEAGGKESRRRSGDSAPVLGFHEKFHQTQVAVGDSKGTVNPFFRLAQQFFVLNRERGMALGPQVAYEAVMPTLDLRNQASDNTLTLAGFREMVNEAQFMHPFRRDDLGAGYQVIRDARCSAPNDEWICPHPREHAEHHLRKPHLYAAFRHHDIARQRAFKTPAQGFPFDQGDGYDTTATGVNRKIDSFNAISGIGKQVFAVTGNDHAPEQIQIAAKIEDTRHLGGNYEKIDVLAG